MGALKTEAMEKIHWAAQTMKAEERELLEEFNRNCRELECMTVDEYIAKKAKK